MDRESLDFGNDSVLNDPVLRECEHGKRWDLCEMADCREIWLLLQEQREEHRKDEEDSEDFRDLPEKANKKISV